ncbi:MAG: B12-binding domain-containing radical SAM protein [Nitrospinae bacterium]|nr:B12-binding domain-containing radical SAM protein [Nitrospinota bacterium]
MKSKSYFKRVALIKAHQKMEPDRGYSSDLTELCHLGAYIEKDVEIVTIPVSPYSRKPFKEFAKSLKRERFDLVGISAMTSGYNNAREYARIAHEAGAYVAMGGYHPTGMIDDVLADVNVDAVIRGEGELPLRGLVLNGPGRDIPGLSFKENGSGLVHNPDQDLIYDMDSLPQPIRRIRPLRFGEKGTEYSVDTLYSSRGCIAKCTFCANDTVHKNFRGRSPEHFIEELEPLHSKSHKKYMKFWDSIFLFDPKRVEGIIDLMGRRDLTNFQIMVESRSDDIIRCEHLMKDLKRIGFDKIQIGIESPDPETYRRLRKGGSMAKHERAIQIVKDAGIKVVGLFIIGHPHETEEDIKKYPEYVKKMGIDHRALYFVMTPYPGTQIFKEYHDKGLIESYDWDLYNNYGAVVHLESLKNPDLRNLLAHCYGSTWGIPYAFKQAKTVPAIFLKALGYTLVWNYIFDSQTDKSLEARNDFMRAFIKAAVGRYRKKRKQKLLGKIYRLFRNRWRFRLAINHEESFVMDFEFDNQEIILDLRPFRKEDHHMLTVTLDDIDQAHRSINMVDINALSTLSFKGSWTDRVIGAFYCFPVVVRALAGFGRLFFKMGWRYLAHVKI